MFVSIVVQARRVATRRGATGRRARAVKRNGIGSGGDILLEADTIGNLDKIRLALLTKPAVGRTGRHGGR